MRPHLELSPRWVSRDGKLLILSRGVRRFAQSSIAVLLALYLAKLGLSLVQIGAFLSAGAAGAAFFAFLVNLIAGKVGSRRLLVTFTLMSAAAGLALVFVDKFLPLMLVAFLGNITGGGAIRPLERASLPDTAPLEKRIDLFAIASIVATGGAALGALAAGLPTLYQNTFGMSEIDAYKAMFVGFTLFLLVGALLYSLLSSAVEVSSSEKRWVNPLRLPSRRYIFTLAGLFSVDHFAGSLVMKSLVAYWFYTRFGLELESLAIVFFSSHLLAVISLWVSAKLGNRIGLINTMVFTHIPASLFLIAAAFAPTAWMAILFWQLRSLLGPMDTPARDSYTMSLVQPNERVAMGGIHAAGKSVFGTASPSVSTALWHAFSASVPLITSGVLRIVYDLSLYFTFRDVKPPQEAQEKEDRHIIQRKTS